MEQRFTHSAATALRIISAYDNRVSDEFEVRAFAMVMAKNPKLEDCDYEEAIVEHYARPGVTRIKAGDLAALAKMFWERRTGARMLATGSNRTKCPKPANYDQMVQVFAGIAAEFRAQGVVPTDEDILRENARRVRESKNPSMP